MSLETTTVHSKVLVADDGMMLELLGPHDAHLRQIEESFEATRIVARGNELLLSGEPESTRHVQTALQELIALARTGRLIDQALVAGIVEMVKDGKDRPSEVLSAGIPVAVGRIVRPKTSGQRKYMDAIASNTVIFGIGPAGTGKTYLAVAAAVEALSSGEVTRIILTRPAVEAGESLGFLPGDLAAKIDPYLRPLHDALFDMLGPEETARLIHSKIIEIAPLAYMRGRTLNDSFVILDEAQNTTRQQMKMFLTRLGFNSKMVITGDVTQTDLPGGTSGLSKLKPILTKIEAVEFVTLTAKDVVRAQIVRQIVAAYERAERRS